MGEVVSLSERSGKVKLLGRVTRVTLRRLRSGALRFDIRVEFKDDVYKSVRLKGVMDEKGWRDSVWKGLNEMYVMSGGLPEPRWSSDSVCASCLRKFGDTLANHFDGPRPGNVNENGVYPHRFEFEAGRA